MAISAKIYLGQIEAFLSGNECQVAVSVGHVFPVAMSAKHRSNRCVGLIERSSVWQ